MRIVANAGGLNPAGLAERLREVAAGLGLAVQVAHVAGRRPPRPRRRARARRRAPDRQRLPRRVRHRRRPRRRRRRRGHRPGHRRLARGRSGDRPLRLDARRRTTRWPAPWSRATSSSAGPRPPAATSPASPSPTDAAARLPARRDRRRRLLRDHQARRHRRRGHRRHGHRPAGLRDPVRDVPRARRVDPPRHRSRSPADGPDRVRVSGVGAPPPPETLKVCVNELGGFRNQAELVLVGLDIEAKAAWVRAQLDRRAAPPGGRRRSSSGRWPAPTTRTPTPRRPRPAGCGSPCATPTPTRVGKAFTAPLVELALASYPGFTLTAAARRRHALRRLPRRLRPAGPR